MSMNAPSREAMDLYQRHEPLLRKQAQRQALKKRRDDEEGLPQTRDIDAALARALAHHVRVHYAGDLSQAGRERSELMHVVKGLLEDLQESGFDAEHPAFKSRVWKRLGDDGYEPNFSRPRGV